MFSIVRKIGSSFVGQIHIFHNLLGLLLMGVMKVAVFMVRAAQRVTAAVVFCCLPPAEHKWGGLQSRIIGHCIIF